MIDSTALGQTAARAMEYLDANEDMDGGRLAAVLVAVIVEDAAGETSFTRTFSSERLYYQQVGLGFAALDCIKDGFRFHPPEEAEGDDDE